jgi:Domain of unknown function (DUF1854)
MNTLNNKKLQWLQSFELSRDEWSHLSLTDQSGNVYKDVSVVPLYPISAPNRLISLVSADGDEIVCLDSLEGISEENMKLLGEELALREFVPIIQKVIRVSGTQEPCEWVVQTNHGETSFVINSEEDVRRVSAKSVVITDGNGNRFRVEDLQGLDSRSRAFVEWYV